MTKDADQPEGNNPFKKSPGFYFKGLREKGSVKITSIHLPRVWGWTSLLTPKEIIFYRSPNPAYKKHSVSLQLRIPSYRGVGNARTFTMEIIPWKWINNFSIFSAGIFFFIFLFSSSQAYEQNSAPVNFYSFPFSALHQSLTFYIISSPPRWTDEFLRISKEFLWSLSRFIETFCNIANFSSYAWINIPRFKYKKNIYIYITHYT